MERKTIVISDVDGCLTNGKFIYTVDGKVAKVFGPHDADGVKLLKKNGIEVKFISADKRGFEITKKRITDMKCELDYVSEQERSAYLKSYVDSDYTAVVFFGDGLGDLAAAQNNPDVYMVAPMNARDTVKGYADYVTPNIGGEGAFLDLAEYIVYGDEDFVPRDYVVDLY